MKKQKIKSELESSWLQVNIETTVQVGEISLTVIHRCELGLRSVRNEETGQYEPVEGEVVLYRNDEEIAEIKYMGMDINGYDNTQKFLKFHKEMGMDLYAHATKKVSNEDLLSSLPKEVIDFVSKYCK